jgi:hypothetical protein
MADDVMSTATTTKLEVVGLKIQARDHIFGSSAYRARHEEASEKKAQLRLIHQVSSNDCTLIELDERMNAE